MIALEQLTNPRLRDEIGEIALVPADDRISGPGASYVMASFTHLNPKGSRFSDGSFGVYYAASTMDVAIAETAHHFEAFARDSADPPRSEDMRVLVGAIAADFEDVAALPAADRQDILNPVSYEASGQYARQIRISGAKGIIYPSVRAAGGACIGAFKPRAVGIPHQERHLQYHWNGSHVDRYFDYARDRWIDIPARAGADP